MEEGEDAELRAMSDTSYFGTVAMIKALLPGMRQRASGDIINISSIIGRVSNPATVDCSSTKLADLGKSLEEWKSVTLGTDFKKT